jgi:SAM-dependent methyltransferase
MRSVVDAACGIGYGSAELAAGADLVVAVDVDPAVLATARQRTTNATVKLMRADLETGEGCAALADGFADAVVSFETLEHLVWADSALSLFARLLRPRGLLICSVPNAAHEARTPTLLPRNPRHRRLFSFDSLARSLDAAGFDVEYRLGQGLTGSILRRETDLLRRGVLEHRLSRIEAMHEANMMRWLARVLAYPSAEDLDRSYTMIVVATRR